MNVRPSVRPSVGGIFWPYLYIFNIINPSFKSYYAGFLPQFRDTKNISNFSKKLQILSNLEKRISFPQISQFFFVEENEYFEKKKEKKNFKKK